MVKLGTYLAILQNIGRGGGGGGGAWPKLALEKIQL